MGNTKFKSIRFFGIDLTPRKRYRREIATLERMNTNLRNSFASGEKDRCDLLKAYANERNKRLVCEEMLARYQRKRGKNGRFIKS